MADIPREGADGFANPPDLEAGDVAPLIGHDAGAFAGGNENVELDGLDRPATTTDGVLAAPPLGVTVAAPSRITNQIESLSRSYVAPLGPEFESLTYTAVTVEPEDFKSQNGYYLRPQLFKKRRSTEILVGITVYNEDKALLCRTLHSVIQSIVYLRSLNHSKTWAGGSWKKVVVCILADGMEAVDPGVLDVLETIGVYQDGLCRKRTTDGREVKGHLFEFTSFLSVTERLSLWGGAHFGTRMPDPPAQLMFFLKSKNCGKLNSYRWLYNAFADALDPNFVVHVDVGTKLYTGALYQLWKEFDLEPRIAAACGELVCSLDGNRWNILNPLVAAQNFEYKVGFQLDRTFESATGYLSVLPGAFSAYRHAGSRGRPLEDTLMGDPTFADAHEVDPKSQSPLNLNRHLADDRAICFQLVSKPESRWILKYSRSKATTDIPTTTTDFITQRRRWLNGAFFSTVYVLQNLRALRASDNSVGRKIAFHIQVFHSILALILAWFSLAAFLLATFTINSISGNPPEDEPVGGFPFGNATPVVNAVIQIIYLVTIVFQFILALGSRPHNHRVSYLISFVIFGIVQVYFIMNIIYLIKRVVDLRNDNTGASSYAYIGEFYADLGPATIIVSAFSVFGVYILAAIMARDGWHLITSFAQFLFISSSYVNILNIYAFSNTHDVTWGQKSRFQTSASQQRRTAEPAAIERRYTFSDQDPSLRPLASPTYTAEARDARYEAALSRALSHETRLKGPKVLTVADKLMEFRTILVASYIFSNFFVCLLVLNDSLKMLWWLGDSYWHKVWFFRIWLWANSISFLIRFLGCTWYWFLKLFRGL